MNDVTKSALNVLRKNCKRRRRLLPSRRMLSRTCFSYLEGELLHSPRSEDDSRLERQTQGALKGDSGTYLTGGT